MKEIKAFIQPITLPNVTHALHHVEGISGMSVVQVQDFGWRKSEGMSHRGPEDSVEEIHHVKIEIVCDDDKVEEVISTIEKTAHTGLRGDGFIYVSPVDLAIIIKTGERRM